MYGIVAGKTGISIRCGPSLSTAMHVFASKILTSSIIVKNYGCWLNRLLLCCYLPAQSNPLHLKYRIPILNTLNGFCCLLLNSVSLRIFPTFDLAQGGQSLTVANLTQNLCYSKTHISVF